MSATEYAFFKKLNWAARVLNLHVLSQVHLDEIVKPESGTYHLFALRHVNQKSVDFVLCDSKTMEPKLAIELDDPSHQNLDRIKRDIVVENILAQAHVKLCRFKVEENNSESAILYRIKKALYGLYTVNHEATKAPLPYQ